MSIVYWNKTNNQIEFTKKVLGIFEAEIDKVQSFLVKPNLVSSEPYPTTTHPEVLEAVLELILSKNKDVVVADGPAFNAGASKKVIEGSDLKKVCDAYQVPFINIYEARFKKFVSPRGYKFQISTLPEEKDLVISLPVLKIHNCSQITGALKNQFGYLPKKERLFMHIGVKNLHQGIAELNVAAKPHLFIVDALETLVDAQEIRHGGKKRKLGYLFAGTDPVALDCFGLKILKEVEPKLEGRECKDILHLKYSVDYNVGSKEFKEKEI